jgi:cytochrome c-type biogenesis protein CcmH/NrfF
MIYFWLIPLALLLFVAVMLMFKNGTKQRAGRSRLDEARSEDLHG